MGALDDLWSAYFGAPSPQQQDPASSLDAVIQKHLAPPAPDFSDVTGGVSSSAVRPLPGNLQGFAGAMPGVNGINIPNTYVPPQPAEASHGALQTYGDYLKTVGDFALDWTAKNTIGVANLAADSMLALAPVPQGYSGYSDAHVEGQAGKDVVDAIGNRLENSRSQLIADNPNAIGVAMDTAANAGGVSIDAILEGAVGHGIKSTASKGIDVLDSVLAKYLTPVKEEAPSVEHVISNLLTRDPAPTPASRGGVDPDLLDLMNASQNIGKSEEVAGKKPFEIIDDGNHTLVATGPDGETVGELVTIPEPKGAGFRVSSISTEGKGTGAGRALMNEAHDRYGKYLGSFAETNEGEGFLNRLRETDPHVFEDRVATIDAADPEIQPIVDHFGKNDDAIEASTPIPFRPSTEYPARLTGASGGGGSVRLNFDLSSGQPVTEDQVRRILPDLPEGYRYSLYEKKSSLRPDLQNWHADIWDNHGRLVGDSESRDIVSKVGGFQFPNRSGGTVGWVEDILKNQEGQLDLPSHPDPVGESGNPPKNIIEQHLFGPGNERAVNDNLPGPHDPPPLPPSGGSGGIHGIDDIPPSEPPEIVDPYEGTPRDIKYKFVGKRQFGDYRLAHENIEMRTHFGDDVLNDATFYLEGTGNPYAEGPHTTHADVVARLASTDKGREIMHYLDTEWPQQTKKLYDSVQQLGFADDMGYVENYIKHTWQVNDTDAKRFAAFLKTSDPFLKKRQILTYEQGIERGLKPKTVNFADLRTLTEKAYNDVVATHEMLDEVKRLPAMPDGNPPIAFGVPEKGEYVKVNLPQVAKVFAEGGKPVYVHGDLWSELKPILTVQNVTRVDEAMSFVKAMNLAFSLFHPATLLESSVNTFGLSRGLIEAGKGGFGVPGLQNVTGRAAEAVAQAARRASDLGLPGPVKNSFVHLAEVFGKPGMEIAEDGIMHGLGLGRPETDVMQSAFFKAMDRISGIGGKTPIIGKSFEKDINFLKKAKKVFDTALWDNYHNPMKLSAYQFTVSKLQDIQAGGKSASGTLSTIVSKLTSGESIKDMSLTEIKRTAAAFVNDEFGGQQWQLLNSKFWSDPATTRVLRRVFTSPDWNVSSVRAATAAASSNPARRILGTRHYINAALGYFGMMNAVNYMMSGHFMWDNEPGKELYLQTWYTKQDAQGREKKVYWQIGKQFSELHDLAFGRKTSSGIDELPVVGFAARKILPIYQAMFAIASGHTISGFPSEETMLRDKVKRPLTGFERASTNVKQIGKSLLPFNVQRVDDPSTIPKLLVPYPESTGINRTRAINLLYDAYKNSDDRMSRKILDALSKNGYDDGEIDDIVKAAERKVFGSDDSEHE